MKITLSKAQWEEIGSKAGWMVVSEDKKEKKDKMCNRCKKKPAMDSYATCEECHDKSLDEAERMMAQRGGDPSSN
jgi:hypothetical protein